MKKTLSTLSALCLFALTVSAQPRFSQPHGLYDQSSLTVTITPGSEGATVRYTTDGSEPTAKSQRYTAPLTLKKTTLLRAVDVVGDSLSPIATATYLFTNSVLSQSNTPSGYPTEWGEYTQISGTAKADYEMDPEMTGDSKLRSKIAAGLKTLPILSVVTDKDNLFSHEPDSVTGGIYIFTGPPVGDNTGHGWTRPASIELFSTPEAGDNQPLSAYDLTTSCGLRLHGGHGRLAEKNPKHSFRLVFKEKYGAKTLKYPLFGEDQPAKFDQLVLRCHFGNTWQHWSEGNRTKAQYTRDVWARRMQRKMGRTSVNALYVHLFLNGMYWGMYNIAERVDDQFGKDHLGGKKSDIDVIKIEEDGGNHIEAAEGTLDAWNEMTEVVSQAAYDDAAYERLDTLLDIDGFIDYMLINQYGGNTDWDHHNWYALRRRGADSEGFRFLCWDTEIIFESENENVLSKNNGRSFPTGIFQSLLHNERFARRYLRRAKEVLASDGLLGEASVVAVWDSLYNTISGALYDEAARWGDYRRDVHRWQSAGKLYTVDDTYMTERNRLLNQYFPVRSSRVLSQIQSIVDVDDFEIPDDWTRLTASMWHEWDGTDLFAQPLDKQVSAEMNLGRSVSGGGVVAGFNSVSYNLFADLSAYENLVVRGTGSGLRILANRLVDHGSYKMVILTLNESSPYWDAAIGAVVLPLDELKTITTNKNEQRKDAFVHLNAIKVESGNTANVQAFYLTPRAEEPEPTDIADLQSRPAVRDHRYYNLSGQRVTRLSPGIYVKNGKKLIVK